MASESRESKAAKRKSRPLNYFYLNGKLHKKLHINRGADELTAWCYPNHVRVTYPYTQTRLRARPAFYFREVAKMLNRGRVAIERGILAGDIPRPQHTYVLDGSNRIFQYLWSEDDVIAAHKYFQQVHFGRPRKDGLVTPKKLPTLPELRAMMSDTTVLYVKTEDGFKPTWEASDS